MALPYRHIYRGALMCEHIEKTIKKWGNPMPHKIVQNNTEVIPFYCVRPGNLKAELVLPWHRLIYQMRAKAYYSFRLV